MSSRWTPTDLANYQAKRGLKMSLVSEPKPNKYHAKRTEVDGIVFHSKREATRYQDLKVMEAVGIISGLTLQPKYPLVVNGVSIGSYVGDFHYIENGENVLEDAKGMKTPAYRIKKKLMLAIYGTRIRET